jgi:hypothetical protein
MRLLFTVWGVDSLDAALLRPFCNLYLSQSDAKRTVHTREMYALQVKMKITLYIGSLKAALGHLLLLSMWMKTGLQCIIMYNY